MRDVTAASSALIVHDSAIGASAANESLAFPVGIRISSSPAASPVRVTSARYPKPGSRSGNRVPRWNPSPSVGRYQAKESGMLVRMAGGSLTPGPSPVATGEGGLDLLPGPAWQCSLSPAPAGEGVRG